MGTLNGFTGKAGCPGTGLSQFTITNQVDTTCSGKEVVRSRESLTIVSVTNGTATNLALTVFGDSGAIDGFVDVPMTIGQPLSLTALTPNVSGSDPKFYLNGNFTGTPTLEILLTYEAAPPELCFGATTSATTNASSVPFTASVYQNGTEPNFPTANTLLNTCP